MMCTWQENGSARLVGYVEIPSGDLTIPDALDGYSVFGMCSGLISATIPDSVAQISEDAFDGCDNLTLRVIQGSYTERYAQENGIAYTVIK